MLGNPGLIAATNRIDLPSGYIYADSCSIANDELRRLDEASNGPFASPLDRASWPREDYGEIQLQIGARETVHYTLVAIGYLAISDNSPGRIDINHVTGSLHTLMVSKEHRHIGLGRAIVLERVRIADELGMLRLSTRLADTNTLRPFYEELGFAEERAGELMRRLEPDPATLAYIERWRAGPVRS